MPLRDEPVDQRFGAFLPDRPQRLEGRDRDDPVHQPARAIVQRRIGLEQQGRRPPRLLPREIGQADAAAGAKGLVVPERRLDLGMAGHAVSLDRLQPDHRPRIPQRGMMRIGIGEERLVERVDGRGAARPSGGVAAQRVGEPVGDIVAAERHIVGADMLDPALARR